MSAKYGKWSYDAELETLYGEAGCKYLNRREKKGCFCIQCLTVALEI